MGLSPLFFLLFFVAFEQPTFSTLSMRHLLYRDTRETGIEINTSPYLTHLLNFALSTDKREDKFLNQQVNSLNGALDVQIKGSFSDISAKIEGTGLRQERDLFKTEERGGKITLGLLKRFSQGFGVEQKIGGSYSSFHKPSMILSNPGFLSITHLRNRWRNLRTDTELNLDLRRLTKEKRAFLQGTLSTKPLVLSFGSNLGEDVYPLPTEQEIKKKADLHLSLDGHMFKRWVAFSLKGEGKNLSFNKEKVKSTQSKIFTGIIGITKNLGVADLTISSFLKNGLTDYRWSPFDEKLQERDIFISLDNIIYGVGSFDLHGHLNIKRFDYPQGERPDDRDERIMESLFESKIDLEKVKVNTSLSARRQDLVFLKGLRSASTRTTDHFKITSYIIPETMEMTFRWEISAFYSIFRFKPENNILLRYLELESKLGKGPVKIDLRSKWQDQGRYVKDLKGKWSYARVKKSAEMWGTLSVLILRFLGISFHLDEGLYWRRQGQPGSNVVYTMSEYNHAIDLRGKNFDALLGEVQRKDEKTFFKVDISWKASF